MSSPKKNDIYIYKKDNNSRPILVRIIEKIEDVKNANDLYKVSHLNTNNEEKVERSQLIVPPSKVLDPLKKSKSSQRKSSQTKSSHTKPFHTVSQSNIDWNLVLNINYKKGDNVLYINKNTGKTEKAKIIKVHYDDNPPYYTINLADGGERETVIERLKPINAGIKSRKNRKSRKRKSRKQKKKRMIKKK